MSEISLASRQNQIWYVGIVYRLIVTMGPAILSLNAERSSNRMFEIVESILRIQRYVSATTERLNLAGDTSSEGNLGAEISSQTVECVDCHSRITVLGRRSIQGWNLVFFRMKKSGISWLLLHVVLDT
jgi:hypothetical protein